MNFSYSQLGQDVRVSRSLTLWYFIVTSSGERVSQAVRRALLMAGCCIIWICPLAMAFPSLCPLLSALMSVLPLSSTTFLTNPFIHPARVRCLSGVVIEILIEVIVVKALYAWIVTEWSSTLCWRYFRRLKIGHDNGCCIEEAFHGPKERTRHVFIQNEMELLVYSSETCLRSSPHIDLHNQPFFNNHRQFRTAWSIRTRKGAAP